MSIDEAFTHFPTLTTSRLHLREIQAGDTEALFAIKSDLEVTRHYGQEPQQSLDDTRAWMQRLTLAYEQHEALYWCLTLKDQHSAIGACTFWNFDSRFYCAEVGYELHPGYWRQGIITEALSAMLSYGFTTLGLQRVEATPLVDNISSQRLLLKLGFRHEGRLRQRHFFRGHFADQFMYGLLQAEWSPSTQATP